jgi:hypothetical protein
MSRVVKRSASEAVKSGRSRRGVPLPQFVRPQLSQPVEKPPSAAQWLHEIKLDGYPSGAPARCTQQQKERAASRQPFANARCLNDQIGSTRAVEFRRNAA